MKTVAAVMLSLFPAAALAAAPVRGADAPEKAADKQDKIVCKTYAEIGSLIATQRVCHTKREWENGRANLTQRDPPGSCTVGGGICNR